MQMAAFKHKTSLLLSDAGSCVDHTDPPLSLPACCPHGDASTAKPVLSLIITLQAAPTICAFAVRRSDADSVLNFSYFNESADTGAKLTVFYLEKDMPLDDPGTIFQRDFLQDLQFSTVSPRWQESFVLAALRRARTKMSTNTALSLQETSHVANRPVSLAELNNYFRLWQDLLGSARGLHLLPVMRFTKHCRLLSGATRFCFPREAKSRKKYRCHPALCVYCL